MDPALLESLRRAKARILAYHERDGKAGSSETDETGRTTGYVLRPVERAGIYTSLIRDQVPLHTLDFALMLEKPQLMAFSKRDRQIRLGGQRL